MMPTEKTEIHTFRPVTVKQAKGKNYSRSVIINGTKSIKTQRLTQTGKTMQWVIIVNEI